MMREVAVRNQSPLDALTAERILNHMVNYSHGLDQTFAALADSTRRDILRRLARGAASVTDLAAGHRVTLPAILKHLAVLERAGLIESHKTGRVRRCRLTPRPMQDAAQWIGFYRQLWETRLERLAEHLRQTMGEQP